MAVTKLNKTQVGLENVSNDAQLKIASNLSDLSDAAAARANLGLENVSNTSDASKNVLSATKLTTARTIELTGDAVGSVSFDGTENVSITVAVQDNSHSHTAANITDLSAALAGKQTKYTTTTTAVSKTLAAFERCYVSAAGATITLPAAPASDAEVCVIVGNFSDTIIDRNGATIMGLAEDLTINMPNIAVTLVYISGDWRFL